MLILGLTEHYTKVNARLRYDIVAAKSLLVFAVTFRFGCRLLLLEGNLFEIALNW